MTADWLNDFKTKGFAKLAEPGLVDLVDADAFGLEHTEEMLRDNMAEDLPDLINKQLEMVSRILKSKYIDDAFTESKFVRYIMWEGVDADSANWHNDGFEGMNVFFLMYFDDMHESTNGAVHFKYPGGEETFYPKRGDVFVLNQSPGFFHRAEKATVQRRQASFDFLVD